MPATSLVVCLYKQRDLLERMLQRSAGCYDDLVVVHDGPDEAGVGAVVEAAGGRFFERPRAFQQEPHMPFAFGQARHDWILHLDADEFPSDELKKWLQEFRRAPEPEAGIAGFTCIWPLWNGQRAVSKKYWDGRKFLFDRRQVRFFGMVEQAVISEGVFQPLDFILHHQPRRKSYGLHNILLRQQAYRWRECIAQSLLGKPTDLACWRWESEAWPVEWEQIRRHPLNTALSRLLMGTFRGLRGGWRAERRLFFEASLGPPIHHAMICLKFRQVRRRYRREMAAAQSPKAGK